MRQARLGLGGDKLDAPTDQHDKRYGCSGGPPQKTARVGAPAPFPLQWRRKERSWRGFRLFRSRGQTAIRGAKA